MTDSNIKNPHVDIYKAKVANCTHIFRHMFPGKNITHFAWLKVGDVWQPLAILPTIDPMGGTLTLELDQPAIIKILVVDEEAELLNKENNHAGT